MDRRLVVLALGMLAVGTGSFVVAGILPEAASSLGVRVGVAGQMVTLFALSFAVLSPVVAAVAGHVPRKRLMLSGLAVFVLGHLLTAVATNLELVLASRVIAGVGAAMFSPTATAVGAALVSQEARGRALAVIVGGLTIAVAFGAPLGTFLAGLGGWRATMWFVAALGTVSAIGVWALLPQVPLPPAIDLRHRLAPLADGRVALTLLTTLAAYGGLFVVFTYVGATFDRVTGGDATVLAQLLLVWGVAAVLGNLLSGRLIERIGSRAIINSAIVVLALDLATMPWTSAHAASAIVALIVWGLFGWGLLVPLQHRLIGIAPATAPLVMGLNTAAIYIGAAGSGVIGAIGITVLDKHDLGLVGAALLAISLMTAELAHRRILRRAGAIAAPALVASPAASR